MTIHERESLRANLTSIRQRIEAACTRSGRAVDSVRLVAVTKSVDINTIRTLHSLGMTEFGENRVGPGMTKVNALDDPNVTWHFIGHLQRNKARKALQGFRQFHGVDSVRLIDVLEREAEGLVPVPRIWIEVNVSGEESKYGITPDALLPTLERVSSSHNIQTAGLMTMAPWSDDPNVARAIFRQLRELRDDARERTGLALEDLSMGMSNDFETAIEEGATTVRVGSALFA